MERDLLAVLIWLAIAISVLVLIQVAVLAALLLMARSMLSMGRQVQTNLRASGVDLYDLAGKCYRLLGSLQAVADDAAEITHSAREGLSEAQPKLARANQLAGDFLDQAEQASQTLKDAVSGPAAEFRAVAAAIRAGLRTLNRGAQGSRGERGR